MNKGTYIGPLTHLQGKTALLQCPEGGSKILAQFDDHKATLSGKLYEDAAFEDRLEYEPHARFPTSIRVQVGLTEDFLGFGWHEFELKDFERIAQ